MDLRIWQLLAEPKHEELVRVAAATNPKDVAAVERLRKITTSGELIHAALQLGEARRKGAVKFGKRAATMWADPQGVEMATSAVVGAYKWLFVLAIWPYGEMVDYCCGIGGDSMALADQHMEVVPVDVDPVRAWMAEQNCGCKALCADINDAPLVDGPYHIDPARRDERGRRAWSLSDLVPSPETWRRIINHRGGGDWGGEIKLGPGVAFEEVEAAFPEAQIEIISENGVLVQAILRFDAMQLRGGPRFATLLRGTPDDSRKCKMFTIRGEPDQGELPHAAEYAPARYIYEPDDSVERAELLGVLCDGLKMPMLHPRVGLLTSDVLVQSSWLTAFEVLEVMPWNERVVKTALEERGAGIVEVKTRGGVVDPDQVQKSLRGSGEVPLTVFVLRFDRVLRAIIARRVIGAQ